MDIPIIKVTDNLTSLIVNPYPASIFVNNYLEAAGVIAAMRSGINLKSIMTKELYKAKITDRFIYKQCDVQGCSA